MSKNTIFGEEHFIDTQMIKLVEQRNNAIDNFVFEQMENTIKGTLFVEMPKVEIDKEKLKKWVILCMKLENIEHSQLVDMATKKRIADLEAKLSEKDKEIEKLKQLVKAIDTYNQYSNDAKNLILLNPDNCYTNGYQTVIKPDKQDKINFAVEQINELKNMLANRAELIDCEQVAEFMFTVYDLEMCSKQLITEIKEGK